MTPDVAHQVWWTLAEIAEARLPDMPNSVRGVTKRAQLQNWRTRPGVVRRRKAKGGGHEFHFSLFSPRARAYLAAQGARAEKTEPERVAAEAWSAFEALSDAAKTKARMRAEAITEARMIESGGAKLSFAVQVVAQRRGIGARSLWQWIGKVKGLPTDQWMPALAGRHKAAARTGMTTEISPEAWAALKADYLRLEAPPLTDCERRVRRIAARKGWVLPSYKALLRMIDERIPKTTLALMRGGSEGLMKLFPPILRDRSDLTACSAVDGDFHKFDVFVQWVEGQAPIRPQISVFHDIYSGKILAWRMATAPNAATVLLTLSDLFRDYGIPSDVVLDNGREYASKWITGGADTRFRFKVNEGDPIGALPLFGVKVHFTTPYHGQSKPIERGFRDLCQSVAKDPRFAGAYVGHKVDAKPENYGSRAVARDEFVRVVAEGIVEFNSRVGRRSVTCKGRSFDETFVESYAVNPVRKATEEQMKFFLPAERRRAARNTGQISYMDNLYWSPWLVDHAGEEVVIRFDPDDLHSGVHVFKLTGEHLGHAECSEAVGFFDMEGGRKALRDKAAWRKAMKAAAQAQITLNPDEYAKLLDEATPRAPDDVAAKVVAPVFGSRLPSDQAIMDAPRPEQVISEEQRERRDAVVADLAAARAATPKAEETRADRVARADRLLAQIADGGVLSADDRMWVDGYVDSPEYRAFAQMRKALGNQG
jgi:transposase InsO family protein